MKKVTSYEITSSSLITLEIPSRINQENIEDFKRKVTSTIVQDLINVYLKNPYLKRPILVFNLDHMYINFDKTFYVIEEEINRFLVRATRVLQTLANMFATSTSRKIILEEIYSTIQEYYPLNVILENVRKMEFVGNESRKLSKTEKGKVVDILLTTNCAIFELKLPIKIQTDDKRVLFLKQTLCIPLDDQLESL